MKEWLSNHDSVMMEGAVVERLRRLPDIELHDTLVNAPLIYSEKGRDALRTIYRSYINIATEANLPIMIVSPTWRTNKERLANSNVKTKINADAVNFLNELRAEYIGVQNSIKIGGLIGCKNDCYKAHETLSARAAIDFHRWQIDEILEGEVDFIQGVTLPSVEEAKGIAKALQLSRVPYFISFVIGRNGRVLDGHSLDEAIKIIDEYTDQSALGYMINCSHPSFLCPYEQKEEVFLRLVGYQANASSLDHCELEDSDNIQMDNIEEWGKLMLQLNKTFNIKILGGCCGTGDAHLQYIAKRIRKT